jgi:hypothetical protein
MRNRYNDGSWLNRNVREEIIAGYSEIIKEHVQWGWKPNYINFMFNHIPGNSFTKMEVMTAEVSRVHDILTRHIVKRPKAANWCHLRPIFIGSHDLHVWKHEKELVRNLVVNDGLHYNVVALVPEESHLALPMKYQFAIWGRRSNLTVPLKNHFEQCQRFYLNDVLYRIHVTPITEGSMADYTLKAFKHGRISPDSIQVWK